jgi:hypothetical protein
MHPVVSGLAVQEVEADTTPPPLPQEEEELAYCPYIRVNMTAREHEK